MQYDLMFGRGYALQRMGLAGLSLSLIHIYALLDNADESQKFATSPLYSTSYSAVTPKDEQVKQPTICLLYTSTSAFLPAVWCPRSTSWPRKSCS